ncbi:MAG: hypothetical protein A2Z01_06130 [Betaproteobacteria bacterium RBG_16_58_11]|nr:MAG: hypothetical protein A2Z01_06130 [Betaproteobacteria bacterium RBG_16_58_11]OFZ98007.1 MAG: hypothetical protein A2Z44_08615 [Betaproteobacteria bacterium RBG_19FT_COMBO_58_11]
MRLYYPKSFLKLILVGFFLVALPLIASIIHAAISADRLAEQSQKAVRDAVLATQSSWLLVEQLTTMERNARQFVVLGDPALFQGYAKMHEKFRETAAKLAGLRLDARQRRQLDELAGKEMALFGVLQSNSPDSGTSRKIVDDFVPLTDLAQSILAGSSRLIDREADTMQRMASEAKRILALETLAVIPILLLAGAFTFLTTRPIRQIDAAIRKLGSGDISTPVAVNGPQDLENLGKRLEWLRLRLIELEAQRNKLLGHISHELKTPLAALREGSELLADQVAGTLNAQQREIADILRQSTAQLQKRIEDLLNFSVAHLRNAALHVSPVELRGALETVLRHHKLAMMNKRLKLVVDAAPITLPCDEEKMMVVIDNLLSNAIKYSPPGGTIKIRLAQAQEQAVLDVVDEGPGIALDEQDKVFKGFYLGKAAREGQVAGTGLGLSIAREYIVAHRGTICIVNEAAKGAHLRIALPVNLSWGTQ